MGVRLSLLSLFKWQFTVHGLRLPVEKHKGCALFKNGLTQRRKGIKTGDGRRENGEGENRRQERRRREDGERRRGKTVVIDRKIKSRKSGLIFVSNGSF